MEMSIYLGCNVGLSSSINRWVKLNWVRGTMLGSSWFRLQGRSEGNGLMFIHSQSMIHSLHERALGVCCLHTYIHTYVLVARNHASFASRLFSVRHRLDGMGCMDVWMMIWYDMMWMDGWLAICKHKAISYLRSVTTDHVKKNGKSGYPDNQAFCSFFFFPCIDRNIEIVSLCAG